MGRKDPIEPKSVFLGWMGSKIFLSYGISKPKIDDGDSLIFLNRSSYSRFQFILVGDEEYSNENMFNRGNL